MSRLCLLIFVFVSIPPMPLAIYEGFPAWALPGEEREG